MCVCVVHVLKDHTGQCTGKLGRQEVKAGGQLAASLVQ